MQPFEQKKYKLHTPLLHIYIPLETTAAQTPTQPRHSTWPRQPAKNLIKTLHGTNNIIIDFVFYILYIL